VGRRSPASSLDKVLAEMPVARQEEEVRDVVVVGGGAAGLSAALMLARARRRVTEARLRHALRSGA